MRYQHVVRGTFLDRPNRFIAHVALKGGVEVCHVKNTGRCRELLTPGAAVYLARSDNPARKTRYDLVAVEKGSLLINMDAQAPNRVFGEDSRFDFRLDTPQGPFFVEVKGVTLEEDGEARFPDAPTERGIKHLRGLRRAVEQGCRAAVFFVVQMKGPVRFRPNDAAHPAFGAALREAAAAGVGVFARDCLVTPESLTLDAPVPVVLEGP